MVKLFQSVVAGLLVAGALGLAGCAEDTTTSAGSSVFGSIGGGGGSTPPPPGTAPVAGSVQFVSATPNSIGVTGSGQTTTATIVFLVSDATSVPIAGATVNFTMVGPAGGTYIGSPGDGTPTTATGTTDGAGNVSVILNSGTVPGPATITATVTSTAGTFSASSSVIAIGGAVPSARFFSLAAARRNLPGLVTVGFTTNVTAYIGDRFSNYNVLQGTQVSFFTEAGAIDTSQAVDATGIATVVLRTQAPAPVPTPFFAPQGNGWVTVIAVVRGEEEFVDSNANGVYDVGEPFTDEGEPYIDADDSGFYDLGEQFVDTNGNGVRNGPNGFWDGPSCLQAGCNTSPNIWKQLRMAFTGNIDTCTLTPSPIGVPSGGSQVFTYTVSDLFGNSPGPGTTISFSATGGTLQGITSITLPDIVGGPYTGSIVLADSTPTTGPEPGSITMTVSSSDVVVVQPCASLTITGTVN